MVDIEKIYNLYFRDVFYFVLSLSKNEDIAKEVTSETFFKILKSKEKLNKIESVKPYVLKIAKNTFLDYMRKNNFKNVNIEDLDVISEKLNPEDEFLRKETESEVYKAILKLDDTDRVVVEMRVFEERSFFEIGKNFGKSENWACVKFYRAKKKLKKFMEDYYE